MSPTIKPGATLIAVLGAVLLASGCTIAPTEAISTSMDGVHAEPGHRAQIRIELASAYYAEGQYPVALREIDLALQISPARSDAHALRALIAMELGEDQQAERSFQKALRLDPQSPGLQNNMGWFLCQTGRVEQAIPYFERAVASRNYPPAKALTNAGICSLRINNVAAAEQYLLRAVQADARSVLAHEGLAKIAYNRADYSRARAHMLQVLSVEQPAIDNLFMAIRIERKLGDRAAEQSLAAQMRRYFPDSPQLAAYLRGELDDRKLP